MATTFSMQDALDCGPDACSFTQSLLTSRTIVAGDVYEGIEAYYERGWTDGLPVVPPTPARVAGMLDAANLAPDEVLGSIPTRGDLVFTAEKVAINAVMAGALPEYMSLIAAAVRALGRPENHAHGHTATLSGAVQMLIVNGPQRQRLSINSQDGAFGPGWRANATIGRALRLVIRNVARSVAGEFDRASYSHPARYSFCFGEDEEAAPDWPTLSESAGLARGADAVTLHASMWHAPIASASRDAEVVLRTLAEGARNLMAIGTSGAFDPAMATPRRKFLFVLGLEHLRVLRDAGLSKEVVVGRLFEGMRAPGSVPPVEVATPGDLLLVRVGAAALQWSWFFCPFPNALPVTEPVA